MNALPEQVGWTLLSDDRSGSSSAVSGGILTLVAEGYREYRAPANWIATVDASVGYMIEFRMRILAAQPCYPGRNVGFWYHDNTYLTVIGIDPDRIYLNDPTFGVPVAPVNATSWHTYRIVVQGTHHRVYVDDALVLDFPHPVSFGGTDVLQFGDMGECGPSQSEWDYVAYETGAVVPVAQTTWGRLKTLYRAER